MNKKISILIVDDDLSTQNILQFILKNAGYEVIQETNGKNLMLNLVEVPDIILLDYNLTGICGAAICTHLKQQERTKDVPVIFMSAAEGIKAIAQSSAADGSIAKPFGIEELLYALQSAYIHQPVHIG